MHGKNNLPLSHTSNLINSGLLLCFSTSGTMLVIKITIVVSEVMLMCVAVVPKATSLETLCLELGKKEVLCANSFIILLTVR